MSAIKSLSSRKFYSLPENPNRVNKNKFSGLFRKREDLVKLVKHIDESLVGKNATFTGPYGRRKVVYCDYEASGRSLQFLEDYILREVLPNCSDATTTANILSLQSILFRHEAREIFRVCVNATDADAVVFTGLGGGGGPLAALLRVIRTIRRDPAVVFVGPCDHPTTHASWTEFGAKVIRISESREGFLDLNDLENQLIAHRSEAALMIGCFSAANSVTGILADDVATTLLLHQHGALAFWDYGIAAPHVQLDMNPTLPGVEERAVQKDAVFFSCHKFLGGIQTPGVIIAKKFLFEPPGSAMTTNVVTHEKECQDVHVEDDRGSVTVVEDVRAGLVMHLKEAVGVPAISSREEKITRTVLNHVKNIPEFVLLGNSLHTLKRLPIFSFIVRHPRGMFLHHNFVSSVLNDVFGIQARGSSTDVGCHTLNFMGIDADLAEEYDRLLFRPFRGGSCGDAELEILRPGFTKITLPFCVSDAELGFILEALKMVATEGWKLLPQYALKSGTGEWRHHSNSIFRDRKWLGSLKYIDGRLVVPERKASTQGTCPADYEECLHVARCIFNKARKIAQRYPLTAQKFAFEPDVEPLRWFMLPSEAHNLLIGNSQSVRHRVPFDPNGYKGCKGDPVNAFRTSDESKLVDGPTGNSTEARPRRCPLPEKELSATAFDDGFRVHQVQHLSPKATSGHPTSVALNSVSSSDVSCSGFGDPASLQWHKALCREICPSGIYSPADVFLRSSPSSAVAPPAGRSDGCSFQSSRQQNGRTQSRATQKRVLLNPTSDGSFTFDQASGCLQRLPNLCCAADATHGCKMDSQHPLGKVHFLLGRNDTYTRQRCNSLGSSMVLHPRSRGNSGYGCRSLTDGETSLNLSECSLSSNEDIHAYVTEVTKELATEIKSEIREVISKVEDVLSDSVDVEAGHFSALAKCEKLERTNSLPSASANDIAQYLMGVSKEMAEEMKTEIRGLVNSVVSPESPPTLDKKDKRVTIHQEFVNKKDEKLGKAEIAVLFNENMSQSRDSGINLSYAEAGVDGKPKDERPGSGTSEPSIKEGSGDEAEDADDVNAKQPRRIRSASIDYFLEESETTSRCRSESFDSLQENDDSDAAAIKVNEGSRRKISRCCKKVEKCSAKSDRLAEESSNDEAMAATETGKPRWCCPPKSVWKPTVEALQEFDMIRDGDRILVCLSGGKNSLAILHALEQYRCYASMKGIRFELGAVTFDSNCPNANIKTLLTYLKALAVPYDFDEGLGCDEEPSETSSTCSACRKIKRGRAFAVARAKNYNVVAFGQNLDDLAETFLLSAFHNGRLEAMKAHYYVPDKGLRVIRPFVYVREKALKQFVESRSLPAVPETCLSCKTMSKERQNSKQLLSHQESMFPVLFTSLRSAMHPLMSGKHVANTAVTEEELSLAKYESEIDSDETSLT